MNFVPRSTRMICLGKITVSKLMHLRIVLGLRLAPTCPTTPVWTFIGLSLNMPTSLYFIADKKYSQYS